MSHLIRGQAVILLYQIGPKNTHLVEDVEIVLAVKFSGFRRSRKCEKLTTDHDGKLMITKVYLSLRLRCTNKNGYYSENKLIEGYVT